MNWTRNNLDLITEYTINHARLAIIPILVSFALAIPLGWLANRNPTSRTIVITAGSLLYTIPSLAMFVFLPVVLGTRVIDPVNVIVALAIYAFSLLVRSTLDALNSIDDGVRQAAVAMGYTPVRRFLTVDLPLSLPVLFAGLRVVSVTNISLVSVGALIGTGGLGQLFIHGFQIDNPIEIWIGIVVTILLALVLDLLIVFGGRLLTPWTRAVR